MEDYKIVKKTVILNKTWFLKDLFPALNYIDRTDSVILLESEAAERQFPFEYGMMKFEFSFEFVELELHQCPIFKQESRIENGCEIKTLRFLTPTSYYQRIYETIINAKHLSVRFSYPYYVNKDDRNFALISILD